MKRLILMVPEKHVARVDRALAREGLAVISLRDSAIVVMGTPPADVPRLISYDGPVLA